MFTFDTLNIEPDWKYIYAVIENINKYNSATCMSYINHYYDIQVTHFDW